jgi:hypothetical protein
MFQGPLRPVAVPTPAPQPPIREPFDQTPKRARQDSQLSDRAYRVLAGLEGYCFGDDRESWVTNKTLGRVCGGKGPNAVRQALRELEALGYLRIEPDPTKMRGQRIQLLYLLKRPADVEDLEEAEE